MEASIAMVKHTDKPANSTVHTLWDEEWASGRGPYGGMIVEGVGIIVSDGCIPIWPWAYIISGDNRI